MGRIKSPALIDERKCTIKRLNQYFHWEVIHHFPTAGALWSRRGIIFLERGYIRHVCILILKKGSSCDKYNGIFYSGGGFLPCGLLQIDFRRKDLRRQPQQQRSRAPAEVHCGKSADMKEHRPKNSYNCTALIPYHHLFGYGQRSLAAYQTHPVTHNITLGAVVASAGGEKIQRKTSLASQLKTWRYNKVEMRTFCVSLEESYMGAQYGKSNFFSIMLKWRDRYVAVCSSSCGHQEP